MKRRSNKVVSVNVTGMFSPFFLNNQPILVALEGEKFLAIFSTPEKLRESMVVMRIPVESYKIKHIDDGHEFLDSVRVLRVMLDPYIVRSDDGTPVTRFTEVFHSQENQSVN